MKILNVDSLITKHLITSLYNKPIYVISEFSKKKVWSKQDSVRRQHHIKRFFASWPCRTLVCTTEIHKIISFKSSWPTTQCLKINKKNLILKNHLFFKIKICEFFRLKKFVKPNWFCTAWISREKLRNCENSSEIYFRDFQTLCKEEGGDDGNFPRVASPKCLQKRFGSVWIFAAFSHAATLMSLSCISWWREF